MLRKLDPLWEFGEHDGGFDRSNLTCKLCGHHMRRGVYRLKYHLAQIPGHEVGPCTNTNTRIIRRALRSLEEIEQTKLSKLALKSKLVGNRVLGGEYESGTGSTSASISATNPVVASSYFVHRTTSGSQPSISSIIKKKEKEEVDKLLGKFLL